MTIFILPYKKISANDSAIVGGKNASLGEMHTRLSPLGISVPDGFATTAAAYWDFLESNGLKEIIRKKISLWKKKKATLEITGNGIRQAILKAQLSARFKTEILEAYSALGPYDVAVRSSATAEDLPEASFAGQHESYLNISGEKALLQACQKCIASLFTDRAIAYREEKGFDHLKIALSVGVQKMVRSDQGASGVMFTLDTENGFPHLILINGIWGLGELIVKGVVQPDEFRVFKPFLENPSLTPIIACKIGQKQKKMVYAKAKTSTKTVTVPIAQREVPVLSTKEILQLARWGKQIEKYYQIPMDIEWAKDGISGQLFIVQARPETVHSQNLKHTRLTHFKLLKAGKTLLKGTGIGQQILSGKICKLKSAKEISRFKAGSILVTANTDPDWVPIMKQASAIITDHGGRTSHAAIVSRELGLPAIVGTEIATKALNESQEVTVSCIGGDTGYVYEGKAEFSKEELNICKLPQTKVKVMLNLANPESAMNWWQLPAQGVGLARMEFIISNDIQIHPMALVNWKTLKDQNDKAKIGKLTKGYPNKTDFFVEKLASGIAKIAASRYPDPVIVRLSDFKTNEYAQLIGGAPFEPAEENPMLGWRGASRYYHPDYTKGFALECKALKKVREEIGFNNVTVMVPFCRTLEEADKVIATMKKYGLERGHHGLELYVMCEIPANVILAEGFCQRFDGFSIGSNDLTQLILGVDRDSDRISTLFDESNPAVKSMIAEVIKKAHKHGCKVGFCGQAPSDHPQYAKFLTASGIDSISVSPDSFIEVLQNISKAEK